MCASDTQAAGVIEAATAFGMILPATCPYRLRPDLADHLRLTTIRQPLFESGVRAVQRLLVGLDDGPMAPHREVQQISLVVRRSTAPPAV